MKKDSPSNKRISRSPASELGGNTENREIPSGVPESAPLPRPARKRQKPKLDRGLPDDAELARLAEAYLERQRKHYPAAAANGIIPVPSPGIIREMVEDFKRRHRGGAVDVEGVRRLLKAIGILNAGGAYNRFSSDNSNPISITDQLMNSLDKSFSEGHLIPWDYVYADFAVTGLDASRQGYSCYKKLLSDNQQLVKTTYIDDFTRASRDELEWWNLAELSKQYGKRLIGASDGFDLSSPHADIMVTVYGLVSRLFIKSLTEKVNRGMKGAADRGGHLGRLAYGFTRRPMLDDAGNVIVDADGLPQMERCIDPVTSVSRRQIYELHVNDQWSVAKITKDFNQRRVDGWDGWTNSTIKELIWSPTAIGVFIWNKTRRAYNHETKRCERVMNPRSQWRVYYDRALAIVPLDLWRAGRRKIVEERRPSKSTGRSKSRNEKNPSTFFSGTLFCACCGKELKLQRSAGAAKQLGVVGGSVGVHGCRLSGSRSAPVIEDCLLGYLRDRLMTPEVVAELLVKTNRYLEDEAKKPIPKTSHLKNRISDRKRRIERLVRRSSETDNDQVAARYEMEIKRLNEELKEDQAVVIAAQAAQRRKIERLDLVTATKLLEDLRAVLNEDVAIAGPAIRELTGPIRVRPEPIKESKGRSRWIATFTPQVAVLLGKLCPSECGQFAAGSLPEATPVEVVLAQVPLYQKLAKEFQRLRTEGLSAKEIAAQCGVGHKTLMDGLHFAHTGEERGSRPKSQRNRMRYKNLAPEVVRLIEEKDMQVKDVAVKLRVDESVVRRAYDHMRPDTPQKIIGGRLCRQRKSKRLPKRVFDTIRSLTAKGKNIKQIAKAAGCCETTVLREQKRLTKQRCAEAARKTA